MKSTITITQKWQMYLPENIREALQIKEPTQVYAEVKGDTLIIKPKKSLVHSMAGSLKKYAKNRKIDPDKLRDHIDYSDL